jgi:signal transduction histidine kinase
MHRLTHICFAILLAAILPTEAAEAPLKSRSLTQLEERRAEIDSELSQLSRYSLRSGIGSIGYRSLAGEDDRQSQWAQIDFGQEFPIDEIVLVPTLWRDAINGFKADGFPLGFRIVAGTAEDTNGTVVAEFNAADALLPRIAPLVVATPGTRASWIRIETTQLAPRAFDGKFVFHLAEIFVFSGSKNIALRRPVQTASNRRDLADSWDTRFLVDGFVPYLMDSAQGKQSQAFISAPGERPALTVDLGEAYPISQIQLHAIEQGDTVPQAYAGDLGIPRHLWIEGANRRDFSDATLLLDYSYQTVNETGPILMWHVPETNCRFIRLTAKESSDIVKATSKKFRIGFAEIMLFANGKNVARRKPIQVDSKESRPNRPTTTLTDGNNLYGRILPIREWLNELSQRHQLEKERPLVDHALTLRYARQKTTLSWVSWLAVLLAVGIGFTVIIERFFHQRQVARIKERLAADLHDELGANLHTIGLIGDLTKEAVNSPDELIELIDRSRELTEISGAAVRHCTNMLISKGFGESLDEDMTLCSTRLLADLNHDITFEGEEFMQTLKAQRRSDLFFFYKECLTNIIRHSGASSISTQVKADRRTITLTVSDNGRGMDTATSNSEIPPSLKRRARLLVAEVSIDHPADGGTRITLKMKRRWWRSIVAQVRGIAR